jgi:CheY-like chemotaxis protein
MPDGDGFDLVHRMAGLNELATIPIIMLTSADAQPRGQLPPAVAAHLTKPVKQSDLLEAIQAAIAPARPGQPDLPAVRLRTRSKTPRLRVLVAEDNLTNQKLLVTLLKQHRHRIVVVENGREAVERSSKEAFDVVLMDVQMPEMSGLEATEAIRARERETGGHVPIVALTAHAMAGDRERCLKAGMDAYLSKPIRPDELLDTLDTVSGRIVGSRPAAAGADKPGEELDAPALLANFNGNATLLGEVIDTFLEDCPRMLEGIHDAARARDPARLQAAAHKLKGAAGLFARTGVHELARKVEMAARAGEIEGLDALYADLEEGVADLTSTLDQLRQRL